MKKNTMIIIAVIAILLIGVGVTYALTSDNDDAANDTTATTQTVDTSTAPDTVTEDTDTGTDATVDAKTVTMTFTNGTFSPSSVTLKAGDTLVVKNVDGSLDFNSDPHPAHTDNPQLNLGDIEDGSSKSIVVTNKGTWGVHNHEDPTNTATVIVQ